MFLHDGELTVFKHGSTPLLACVDRGARFRKIVRTRKVLHISKIVRNAISVGKSLRVSTSKLIRKPRIETGGVIIRKILGTEIFTSNGLALDHATQLRKSIITKTLRVRPNTCCAKCVRAHSTGSLPPIQRMPRLCNAART